MPTLKEIMVHVKKCVKDAPKSGSSLGLTKALYLSGIMLYAVHESSPNGVNDLLRELMSILR
jgi:hypothetical protein